MITKDAFFQMFLDGENMYNPEMYSYAVIQLSPPDNNESTYTSNEKEMELITHQDKTECSQGCECICGLKR